MVELEECMAANPHLRAYMDAAATTPQGRPAFVPQLTRDLKSKRPYNLVYPVGDPVFIHVVEDGSLFPRYRTIEPALESDKERQQYAKARQRIFQLCPEERVPETASEYADVLSQVLKRISGGRSATDDPTIRYYLERDIVEHGILEPVMRDPWIEDIHAIGTRNVFVVHKIFGTVETTIRFDDVHQLDRYLETMGERMGRPINDSAPIVDGALPNGSRINVVFGDSVSKGGSSFTVRKFSETPLPVTQLVAWNTFDARLAAYLWMCLEHGMSVFVAGETASGKTTSLNSFLPFIHPRKKILTAEDTPEVLPPQENWQQLVTREKATKEGSVSMYDLLKAGLRSRPNYIIVGEIRGVEGGVAFQAMQTGHPTIATFHASSVAKLIQRFTSDPINVPLPFMPNLNVVLIQMAVYVRGRMLRRVLAVEEIEAYNKRTNSVITRQVFTWDPLSDKHLFPGRNNSYVLENLVAPKLGLQDRRAVYAELERRRGIIDDLVRRGKFDYHELAETFKSLNLQKADEPEKAPAAPKVTA